MSKSQVIGSIRSCMRHMQAKVTIHQMSVKSAKEKRAISQEVLAACRQQAREKIPQLLGENQTGVLTNITIQEVNKARKNSGPDASGFVINVSNMAKNFHPPEIRSRLSAVMCHDPATADKFYVRHLNMEQSHEIRRLFVEATHGAAGPAPSSTSLPEPRVPAKPRSDKRKRRVSVSESCSSEEAEVPYQESGSSALEEEMEEITLAKRRLAKKREGDGKEEEDDDDDEQEQGEKDQQEEEEDQQQQEEEQQEEEDLKVRDFLTLFIFTLCNSSFDS
ncbi:hypothetical protein XENOCAPTIV_011536 [Xenoophorus captivus]|uniref:Uncharacterized protein n=1 Tax=Xenoophorus captivus TaxID=1517983 RepID=A0ABV0QZV1_9TELE